MSDRIGNPIQTFTGRAFYPLDPRPDDVCIEDIARSLSMRCRYGGHVRKFYSVAEHSVLVSQGLPKSLSLWGLLHDAAEAYSADVPRPLKLNLPGFAEMEAKIMSAICERFGLSQVEPPQIKKIDFAICADERAALCPPTIPWPDKPEPLGVHIMALDPDEAEMLFLSRFRELQSAA